MIRRVLRRSAMVFAGTVLVLFAATWALLLTAWLLVPDVSALKTAMPERTSYMRLLAEERGLPGGGPRLEPLPLEQISPLLACAVVKAEDQGFFEHQGFVWERVRAAARARLAGERSSGGSTITQQLARNLYLSPERTLWRKLREAFIADRLEHELGKRRILELYLNSIEWGDGIWGVGPAAARLLGKRAGLLDAFDGTFLASLVAAPRTPLQDENLLRAAGVQGRVLRQLLAAGLIPREEWRRAYDQATRVWTALAGGAPLASALPAPTGDIPPDLRWDDVLASSCGTRRSPSIAGARRPDEAKP